MQSTTKILVEPNRITRNVFISYSRKDAALVKPVVGLMRATSGSKVFFDLDSVLPGELWRNRLDEGLEQAELVVVFWCEHSQASEEVTREYHKAVECEKAILPVLLDSTPLPIELTHYQFLDFQKALGKKHRSLIIRLSQRFRWVWSLAHSLTTSFFMVVVFIGTFAVGSFILFRILDLPFLLVLTIFGFVSVLLVIIATKTMGWMDKHFTWWAPAIISQPLMAEIFDRLAIEPDHNDHQTPHDDQDYDGHHDSDVESDFHDND